jgi:hypothetical protein
MRKGQRIKKKVNGLEKGDGRLSSGIGGQNSEIGDKGAERLKVRGLRW